MGGTFYFSICEVFFHPFFKISFRLVFSETYPIRVNYFLNTCLIVVLFCIFVCQIYLVIK